MNNQLTCLAIASIISWCGVSSAADSGPTASYRLSDVTFEYETSGGYGAGGGSLVRVSGSGEGSRQTTSPYEKEPAIQRFKAKPERILELLNLCYQQYFFDLRPVYGGGHSVRLGPNGDVQVLETIFADSGSRSVTVRIGPYIKSVGYSSAPGPLPPVVTTLAREIESMVVDEDPK